MTNHVLHKIANYLLRYSPIRPCWAE